MALTVPQRSTQSSQLFILALCLTFRFINAYLTRTYDNPDEYWQGQEVAHNIVFGYGYLTWEWREKIRSYVHPLTIAALYKLLQILHLDNTQLLIAAPRYFQATLGAFADVSSFTLAKKVFGNEIALPMLFTTLCSWFNFLMAARTLSNSMEMVFTIIALNYWPLPGLVSLRASGWLKDYRIALIMALIACVMRPTNGLIWLFLGTHLILSAKHNRIKVIVNAFALCFTVFSVNALVDTRIYNKEWNIYELLFTPYLFFKVNVLNKISLFYGVHTWYWYLSQGIPVIFTTFLPLLAYGLYCIYHQPATYQRVRSLLFLSLWVIAIYSFLPHKEFRFIFPVVPILLMVTAYGLQQISSARWRKRIILLLITTQFPLALYLSLWHQRGVMDVMFWLRSQPVESVGILMPCHSTPWYSTIHKQIPMWFLTCEPPLQGSDELDEADQFYQDPLKFLQTIDTDGRVWPTSHLILFDNLLPKVQSYLSEHGYQECQRFFNSHFHDDARRRGDVVVLCSL